MRTETRPAALSGVKYRPQFVMTAVPHRSMRPSYMQMDWVRYYSLARHNARSISAPLDAPDDVPPRLLISRVPARSALA